jgi:pilus assembly protein CpaB
MFIKPADSIRTATLGELAGRELRRFRRIVVAVLAGLATLIILSQLSPGKVETVTYVAAASAIPAGHVVTAQDVNEALWPTDLAAPTAYTSVDEVLGRTTAGPVAAGELIGQTRLVGPGLLSIANATTPSGQANVVAAPVRLADPDQVALVRPGDVVDVLAARAIDGGGQSATLVASGVTVITVPDLASEDVSTGLLGAGGSASSSIGAGRLVVLAVDSATATDLAAAATRSQLSIVIKPDRANMPRSGLK